MDPARHRLQGRHRSVRPRFGRIAVASVSSVVTAVALLGGLGLMPSLLRAEVPAGAAELPIRAAPSPSGGIMLEAYAWPTGAADDVPAPAPEPSETDDSEALPPRSGTGHRVVFSESRQRVWLVSGGRKVKRTYLVSGSLYDNLEPGTYEVYSTSEQAWGVDGSGTMRYFVRFTRGARAAIGFHDIPVLDGRRVQTLAELGTATSHGCIRQQRSDARVLWRFAPIGTTVVVTA